MRGTTDNQITRETFFISLKKFRSRRLTAFSTATGKLATFQKDENFHIGARDTVKPNPLDLNDQNLFDRSS